MSIEAINWALRMPGTPTQKHLLMVMANYANESGIAFPSVGTLMADTGMGKRTIVRAKKELLEAGLIEKMPRYGQSGIRLSIHIKEGEKTPQSANPAPQSATAAQNGARNDTSPHGATAAPQSANPAPQSATAATPPNHQLTTINHHSIPPTPQPKKSAASKSKAAMPKIDLPDWMPLKAWDGWLEMRRGKKCPATPRVLELAVKKLADLRAQGHAPEAVLDQSTMMGWQGLFPVKPERTGPLPPNVTPFPRPMSQAEQNRRASIDRIRARQEALRNAQ